MGAKINQVDTEIFTKISKSINIGCCALSVRENDLIAISAVEAHPRFLNLQLSSQVSRGK